MHRVAAAAFLLASTAGSNQNDDVLLNKVWKAYEPVLIKIQTDGIPQDRCQAEGTGFVVGQKDGRSYIVTASHVLVSLNPSCKETQIVGRPSWEPDTEIPLRVELNKPTDVALLSTSWEGLEDRSGLTRLCSTPLGQDQVPIARLIYLGYFSDDLTALPGWGRIETNVNAAEFRQRIGALVDHGLSGGPIFDQSGNLIGIMRERLEKDAAGNQVSGRAFITPVGVVQHELKGAALKAGGSRECIPAYESEQSSILGRLGSTFNKPAPIISTYQISRVATQKRLASLFAFALPHREGLSRRPVQFEERFSAAAGYKFERVLQIKILGHNLPTDPVPTVECADPDSCIKVSEDGKSLIARYKLWTGINGDNRDAGSLDMLIVAEQGGGAFPPRLKFHLIEMLTLLCVLATLVAFLFSRMRRGHPSIRH